MSICLDWPASNLQLGHCEGEQGCHVGALEAPARGTCTRQTSRRRLASAFFLRNQELRQRQALRPCCRGLQAVALPVAAALSVTVQLRHFPDLWGSDADLLVFKKLSIYFQSLQISCVHVIFCLVVIVPVLALSCMPKRQTSSDERWQTQPTSKGSQDAGAKDYRDATYEVC